MTWLTPTQQWRSGPWSLQLRDDEFAEIRFDGRRVLRSVRAVVRDHDWATADLVVDRVRETDSTLTLHVRSVGLGSSFAGVVWVEARECGLRVICDLESAEPYRTNRTGLVVLHPPQVAGAALEVTHAGRHDQTRFPEGISPHQPVFDIAGLAWEDDGLAIDIRFEGDVFEMEDQRNWSDASFKTYSRPLALPFPYDVAAGERVVQTVEITVSEVAEPEPAASEPTRLTLEATGTVFPDVLVAASTAPDPAPSVRASGAGLIVELDLASTNWRAALDRALATGTPVDVRLVLPKTAADAALDALLARTSDAEILRIAAFDPDRHVTDAEAAAAVRGALARDGRKVPVIGGARSHFTEYNREHARIPTDLDGVVIATTPLFHALGTEQLIESVAMQRLIAQQAVEMADGAPVHIGPIALRPRFNNVATAPQPAPTRDDLAEGYGAQFTGADDPRQFAPELGAWAVASAAALAVPGVASVTWFEQWGPRGIHTSEGTPLPVATAITALADQSGGALLSAASPDGLVWAVGVRAQDSTWTALLANLDGVPRPVELDVDGQARRETLPPFGWVSMA